MLQKRLFGSGAGYASVPVMIVVKAKLVMFSVRSDNVKVSSAGTTSLGFRMWFSCFQVSVMYWSAFWGSQFVVVMFRVAGTLPVFFT